LLRLAGCERLVLVHPGVQPLDLSCQLRCGLDGAAEIHVQRTALQNARLSLPGAYAWMRRLVSGELVVNLEELPHINSVLVAWILQLSQAAKPAQLTLRKVARQVNIQLMQLRLHHLLSVKTID
jgi:hypothetical protein